MSDPADTHINQDILLRAVIDESDLAPAERAHLACCVDCRARISRFDNDLAWLGRQARQSAPPPQRRIALPLDIGHRRLRPWVYGLATAAVTLSAVALIWMWNGPQSQKALVPQQLANGVEDRVAEAVELQALTVKSLPDVYLDMIGDEESGFSDEFLEFVSPIPDQHYNLLDGNYNCKEIDYA